MKLLHPFAAALLWQSALLVNIGAVATPEHLRYQRAVLLPRGTAGRTCVALDASTLAHTASAAHSDLRIFRNYEGRSDQVEIPYILTESGPEPIANAQVVPEHLVRRGDALEFDLRMPPRPYSEIQLQIHAFDFVGTVLVYGADTHGRRQALGDFGIFDLTHKGLGRWTVLPMAETSLPLLHLVLTLHSPDGVPMAEVPLSTVAGASVPPSRERQTLYTPVASTSTFVQRGNATVGTIHVPAHVPVEEVRFTFPEDLRYSFARDVLLRAQPDGEPLGDTEVIDAGMLEDVSIPSGDPRVGPITVKQNSLDATLGATLASNATVRVLVDNRDEPPLPIREVSLEMRERKLCFLAIPGAEYTLRYGDPALAAPLYDDTALLAADPAPVDATLGPERRNPNFRPRQDTRPLFDRHPELFWVLVLLCGGMMAGSALHFVQHQGTTAKEREGTAGN